MSYVQKTCEIGFPVTDETLRKIHIEHNGSSGPQRYPFLPRELQSDEDEMAFFNDTLSHSPLIEFDQNATFGFYNWCTSDRSSKFKEFSFFPSLAYAYLVREYGESSVTIMVITGTLKTNEAGDLLIAPVDETTFIKKLSGVLKALEREERIDVFAYPEDQKCGSDENKVLQEIRRYQIKVIRIGNITALEEYYNPGTQNERGTRESLLDQEVKEKTFGTRIPNEPSPDNRWPRWLPSSLIVISAILVGAMFTVVTWDLNHQVPEPVIPLSPAPSIPAPSTPVPSTPVPSLSLPINEPVAEGINVLIPKVLIDAITEGRENPEVVAVMHDSPLTDNAIPMTFDGVNWIAHGAVDEDFNPAVRDGHARYWAPLKDFFETSSDFITFRGPGRPCLHVTKKAVSDQNHSEGIDKKVRSETALKNKPKIDYSSSNPTLISSSLPTQQETLYDYSDLKVEIDELLTPTSDGFFPAIWAGKLRNNFYIAPALHEKTQNKLHKNIEKYVNGKIRANGVNVALLENVATHEISWEIGVGEIFFTTKIRQPDGTLADITTGQITLKKSQSIK